MDMVGYVYEDDVILFNLDINVIKNDKSFSCNNRFQITLYRQMNISFILVVKSVQQLEEGVFSIIVNGPSNVSMKRIGTHSF